MPEPATREPLETIGVSALPSLRERLRLGAWILCGAQVVFVLAAPFASTEDAYALTLVHLTRLVSLALGLCAFHLWPTHRTMLVVGITVACAQSVFSAATGVLNDDYISNTVFCCAFTWGAATLIPWGPVAQAILASVSAGSLLVDAYFVKGSILAAFKPHALMTLSLAMAFSVYVAYELRRGSRTVAAHLVEGAHEQDQRRAYQELLSAMHQAESRFIAERRPQEVFDDLLTTILRLTGSEYGFIGEVRYTEDEQAYLVTHAITDIAWNEETRALYGERAPMLEFHNFDTLFGAGLRTGEPVIANDPATDPRSGGLPPGHPPLTSFLGLPFASGERVVGMIGVANRPGGYDWRLVDYLQPLLTTCAHLTEACRTDTLRQQAEEEVRRLNLGLERRVRERTTELEVANRELEGFSYSVSHDLRTPLRGMSGFSQVLLEEYGDKLGEEGAGYLRRVRDGAVHMGRLIDDLLTLARVTRSELSRERLDLTAMARQTVTEFREAAPDRRVESTIEDELIVSGDPMLMRILLLNLLGNAWKFTGLCENAKIELGVAKKNGGAVYFVRDNGAGFDMSFARKLFKPFERLHDDSHFEGTGIGLATVKRIVERHGGKVWAEGLVNHGATFFFTLPDLDGEPTFLSD